MTLGPFILPSHSRCHTPNCRVVQPSLTAHVANAAPGETLGARHRITRIALRSILSPQSHNPTESDRGRCEASCILG